jgi:two-component system chemotaxis sensor kinase CheA
LPTLAADELTEAVNAAFRDAHTVKGNARNYGFVMIAEKAHRAEDLLAGLRDADADVVQAGLHECRERFLELRVAFEQLTGLGRKFASFSQSRAFSPDIPESALARFHRHFEVLVNQLAQALHKEIGFELVNTLSKEVPGALLDAIRDPIGHLLRNAADHAIEKPDEREACGKPRCGLLRITLAHREHFFVIGLRDDGRGIAYEEVLARAVERGLVPAGIQPNRRELLGFLFHPGFSTRESASDYSGRGVGLDAVRAQIKRLGGRIEVRTSAGMGTEFSLLIPETPGAG